MRAVVTGQIGVDKKPYLEQVVQLADDRGESIVSRHVGDLMYAEAPDISSGRILDLSLSRLDALRRSVFKDIIAQTQPAADTPNLLVNTRARISCAFQYALAEQLAHDARSLNESLLHAAAHPDG